MKTRTNARYLAQALALVASLLSMQINAASDASVGVADSAGILVVKVGEMRFFASHAGLSECSHGAVLDEAALWHVGTPQAAMILLRERWHTPRGSRRVRAWGTAAREYLVESKGIAPGRVAIQVDSDVSQVGRKDLESTVEVYAVLRGRTPNAEVNVDSYFTRARPLVR
jgi:hypothetical protein